MALTLCIYLCITLTAFSQDISIEISDKDDDFLPIRTSRTVYCQCRIDVCAHGDDSCQLLLSQDAGSTWSSQAGPTSAWWDPMDWNYGPNDEDCISPDTRLRFVIEENGVTFGTGSGPIGQASLTGGFIAGIKISGNGPRPNPISCRNAWVTKEDIEGTFNQITTSGGSLPPNNYVYTDLGDGIWGNWYEPTSGPGDIINYPDTCLVGEFLSGMQWVWNGQRGNTMTYTFSFEDYEDLLKECCVPVIKFPTKPPTSSKAPTPAPTNDTESYPPSKAPTPCQTIEIPEPRPCPPLRDYLDECYCNVTPSLTTKTPTPAINPAFHPADHPVVVEAKHFSGKMMMNNPQFKQDLFEFIKDYDENEQFNNYIMYGFIGVNSILIMIVFCCAITNNKKTLTGKGYIVTEDDDEIVKT